MLRVGMLTSGGDCQALNAAMRGVAKSLYEQCSEVEIYGFEDGYRGAVRFLERPVCRLSGFMSRMKTEGIK